MSNQGKNNKANLSGHGEDNMNNCIESSQHRAPLLTSTQEMSVIVITSSYENHTIPNLLTLNNSKPCHLLGLSLATCKLKEFQH